MGNLFTSVFLFMGSILGVIIFYKPNYFVETKKKIKVSANEVYLKTQLLAFLKLFQVQDSKANLNIKPNSTKEEEVWERRKLFENTPVGNVFMWYDLYKDAFCYCSDTQISYSILNACAMKYTRLYFCRDFFVDTNVIPDSFENPFNQQKDDEDKKERERKKEKKLQLGIDFDPKAFVSSKQSKQDVEVPKTIYKNTFRYMGKLSSQSFLQKPLKKSLKREEKEEGEEDYVSVSTCSYKDWKSKLRDFTCL